MNTKKYILLSIAAVLIGMSSCDKYLNVEPDNRVSVDTPDKVRQLLINAYPNGDYNVVTELSADNFFDNASPNSAGVYVEITAFNRMDDDIFAWNDPQSYTNDGNSPYDLWQRYYQSIASANAALQAIDEIFQKGGVSAADSSKILLPCKGEALILRAYSHFMLVNIFSKAYKDAEKSKSDLGIRYVTAPINEVTTESKRNSVAEVYDLIAKDIEAGIGLIDDALYKTATNYHFNTKAAHAFAAQFYLFKRDYAKVIEHANVVLGSNPSSVLRDWTTTYSNSDLYAYSYIDANVPANLLILPTYSTFFRRFINSRYEYNDISGRGSIDDNGPTWNGRAPFANGWMWTYNPSLGSFMAKSKEQFEYTDKVARIGYPHIVRTEYTTDATLLDRAEAYIFLNQIDNAVADLQAWNLSHKSTSVLTKAVINNFYTPNRTYFSYTFHNQELSPEFTVTADQKPFVDCVLHFRRLDKIFEGTRWFDIKRYGIELEHVIGHGATRIKLTYDDERRAIQIPSDVIGAGVEPNPRPTAEISPDIIPYRVE